MDSRFCFKNRFVSEFEVFFILIAFVYLVLFLTTSIIGGKTCMEDYLKTSKEIILSVAVELKNFISKFESVTNSDEYFSFINKCIQLLNQTIILFLNGFFYYLPKLIDLNIKTIECLAKIIFLMFEGFFYFILKTIEIYYQIIKILFKIYSPINMICFVIATIIAKAMAHWNQTQIIIQQFSNIFTIYFIIIYNEIKMIVTYLFEILKDICNILWKDFTKTIICFIMFVFLTYFHLFIQQFLIKKQGNEVNEIEMNDFYEENHNNLRTN